MPEIVVAPAGLGDPVSDRFKQETAATDCALETSENCKNEQKKRSFV